MHRPHNSPENYFESCKSSIFRVYFRVELVATIIQHLYHKGDGYNAYEVSMALQSSGGPFIAERPMYWNAAGTQ
jgi:hypothetical protein